MPINDLMSPHDGDSAYFNRLAERQPALAEASNIATAVAAHCALADHYLELRDLAERAAA